MKIAYLEDDKYQTHKVSSILRACLRNEAIPIEVFDCFSGSEEFLSEWHPKKYDLILLDIFLLGESSGITIAKTIREKDQQVRIAFCSSSNDYAYESYEVAADYYITKPVTYNKIAKLVERIKPSTESSETSVIYCKGKKINVENIVITQYHNHVITIFLKSGEEIKVRLSQQEFIRQISKYNFLIIVNPGTIVNMKEIVWLKDGIFALSNGMQGGISRRRRQTVIKTYNDFTFEELRRS